MLTHLEILIDDNLDSKHLTLHHGHGDTIFYLNSLVNTGQSNLV